MKHVHIHCAETERHRQQMLKEVEEHRKHRQRLDAIAAKEDLFGPDALSAEERALKERHAGYFALKEGR